MVGYSYASVVLNLNLNLSAQFNPELRALRNSNYLRMILILVLILISYEREGDRTFSHRTVHVYVFGMKSAITFL